MSLYFNRHIRAAFHPVTPIAEPDPHESDFLKEAAALFIPVKPSKTKRSKVQPITKAKSTTKQLRKKASK